MRTKAAIRLLTAVMSPFILASGQTFASDAGDPVPDSLRLAGYQPGNETVCRLEIKNWESSPGASSGDSFRVYTHFQGGSGRYWNIAIRNARHEEACLTTTTIGFRSLQRFSELPLPWTRDFDGDGVSEVIYWYSFALGQSSADGYGLSARVYQRRDDSLLVPNPQFTGKIVKQIIDAYRLPIAAASQALLQQRERALTLLQMSLAP